VIAAARADGVELPESLVETQITYVSVGTRRDQIIGVEGALPAGPVGVA